MNEGRREKQKGGGMRVSDCGGVRSRKNNKKKNISIEEREVREVGGSKRVVERDSRYESE